MERRFGKEDPVSTNLWKEVAEARQHRDNAKAPVALLQQRERKVLNKQKAALALDVEVEDMQQ
eukprot:8442458-Prorocentrum_lima.AAC.1